MGNRQYIFHEHRTGMSVRFIEEYERSQPKGGNLTNAVLYREKQTVLLPRFWAGAAMNILMNINLPISVQRTKGPHFRTDRQIDLFDSAPQCKEND